MTVTSLDDKHLLSCAKSLFSQAKSLRVQSHALLRQANSTEKLARLYRDQVKVNAKKL